MFMTHEELDKQLDDLDHDMDYHDLDCEEYEDRYLTLDDDGQPDEYTEWQDFNGGDDWDHGQYECEQGMIWFRPTVKRASAQSGTPVQIRPSPLKGK